MSDRTYTVVVQREYVQGKLVNEVYVASNGNGSTTGKTVQELADRIHMTGISSLTDKEIGLSNMEGPPRIHTGIWEGKFAVHVFTSLEEKDFLDLAARLSVVSI